MKGSTYFVLYKEEFWCIICVFLKCVVLSLGLVSPVFSQSCKRDMHFHRMSRTKASSQMLVNKGAGRRVSVQRVCFDSLRPFTGREMSVFSSRRLIDAYV